MLGGRGGSPPDSLCVDAADDFGSDEEDNDFGEEEDEDGGSDYDDKRGKKSKKAKPEKPGKRGPKRKRAAGKETESSSRFMPLVLSDVACKRTPRSPCPGWNLTLGSLYFPNQLF